MFGFIKGIIAYKNNNTVVLDNNGVGYELIVSNICFNHLGEIGEEAKLWTHLHVREDEMAIIGFEDLQEREVFRKLISVNGVGPKMALTILGGVTAKDLSLAIATQNPSFLKNIKGVGTKIRERIMLELKEKMNSIESTQLSMMNFGQEQNALFDNAISILMDWGVQKSVAEQIIKNCIKPDDNMETLLAKAFKEMGR